MIIFNLDKVSVTYLDKQVFEKISWEIHSDRVAGLVGPNGAGKSTLLRLIAGELTTDTGFVVPAKKGLRIGYLQQEPQLTAGRTVIAEVHSASEELGKIENQLSKVESIMGDPAVYNEENKLEKALKQQEKLLAEFERLGGANYPSRVRSTLISLGFTETDLELKNETLSGGQKKLVGLAKLLVTQPDLLLLDEPDNHLDLEGKAFLEKYIRGFKGGVVIVSHDRYMLDMVVDEIIDLEDGKLSSYSGNYSEFAYEKQARLMTQAHQYQAQQKEINRLEHSAQRLLTWGRTHDNNKLIRRGKSMLKRIEKIERIDEPVLERKRMGLELSGLRGSNKVLETFGLGKTFDVQDNGDNAAKEIFSGLDMLIHRGERVGLVGPNAAGKSVLFRLFLGRESPTSGEIKIGPSVKVGYYSQEHETLNYQHTLLETVRLATKISENNTVSFLGRFLFTYEQSRRPISDLSGGERSRLQMALLMLSGANFLLLDEPTNNLDIPSAEVLEAALEDFDGTLLVISHDRYFLDRVVNRVIELEDGKLTEYPGAYSEYQAAKGSKKYTR